MKKFKFRFQKILEYKQTIEDLKRAEYNSEVQALNKEKEKLNELFEKSKTLNDERNKSTTATTVKDLKLYNEYLTKLNEKIQEQMQITYSKERDVAIAKEILIKSVQEKKTFEKLKAKDYDQYNFEIKKEEEKIVDQIVSFNNSTK